MPVEFFPLSGANVWHRREEQMHLRTVVGVVELTVWHGQDAQDKHWGCPIRELWALRPHQQISPVLEQRLAFTATATSSYQEAALLAENWGCKISASTVHQLAQRLGLKAEQQTQARLKQVPVESQPKRKPSELAVLMADGWLARFRGLGWGMKKTNKDRVEWHEIKVGIFYRQEQAAQTQGGRRVLDDKLVVHWQGEPLELGRRLHWEALRAGLARAKETLVLGDGSPWIWNMAADRWPQARQLLDFYHASQHLWQLGRAIYGENDPKTKPWVEQRLHQLRHGLEQSVFKRIAALKVPRGERGKAARKEQGYFAGQAHRMNYEEIADRGWSIGSGPVESTCRQSQCRFKRPGQFWTKVGFRNLCALDEARRNNHWDELWSSN